MNIKAMIAERNRQIADEYFAGGDLEVMSVKFGVTPLTIRQISHEISNGRRRIGSGSRPVDPRRDALICEQYLSGRSLESVGGEHGITHERVRQILVKCGHEERHQGFNTERRVAARVALATHDEKRMERKAAQNARRARIRQLYDAGHTYIQISELTGQGSASILNDLWRTGGPNRNALAGQTNRKLTVADREDVIREYCSGASLNAIASKYGLTVGSVQNIAALHGAKRPREMRASH